MPRRGRFPRIRFRSVRPAPVFLALLLGSTLCAAWVISFPPTNTEGSEANALTASFEGLGKALGSARQFIADLVGSDEEPAPSAPPATESTTTVTTRTLPPPAIATPESASSSVRYATGTRLAEVNAHLSVRDDLTVQGAARILGLLTVGGTGSFADMLTAPIARFPALTADTLRAGSVAIARGATVAGALAVGALTADEASVRGDLTVTGTTTLATTTTGALVALGGLTTNGADIDAGSGSIRAANILTGLTAGRNITIDTTDPQKPTIKARGGGGGGNTTIVQGSDTTAGAQGQVAYYGADGTTLSGTDALYVDALGNVGVGTTSPGVKLSVAGQVTADSFNTANANVASNFAGGFTAGGVNGLTVLQNGYISVGKNTPRVPLDFYNEDYSNNNPYDGSSILFTGGLVQLDGLMDLGAGARATYAGTGSIGRAGGPLMRGEANRWHPNAAGSSMTIDIGRDRPVKAIVWGTYWPKYHANDMKNYSVDYSLNGVDWTNWVTVTNNTKNQVVHYLPTAIVMRYIRITSLDGTGGMSTLQILGYNIQSPITAVSGDPWGFMNTHWTGSEYWAGNNIVARAVGGVGIGTDIVNSKLVVNEDKWNNYTNIIARFQLSSAPATSTSPTIRFDAYDNTGTMRSIAGIGGVFTDITSESYKGALAFYTANNSNPVENARLTYDGKLGIGTTSPYAKLSITGTAGQTNPLLTIASSSGTSLLTVDANGNVGVGTTTLGNNFATITAWHALTSKSLTVDGSIYTQAIHAMNNYSSFAVCDYNGYPCRLAFGWADSATHHRFRSWGAGNAHLALEIVNPTNHYFVVNGLFKAEYGALIGYPGNMATSSVPTNGLAVAGNVGIGTTAPTYKLTVYGTTSAFAFIDEGVILTAPDYVFDDPAYMRLSLDEIRAYTEANAHLPWLTPRGSGPMSLGARINEVLEALENLFLKVFELVDWNKKQDEKLTEQDEKLTAQDAEIAALKARNDALAAQLAKLTGTNIEDAPEAATTPAAEVAEESSHTEPSAAEEQPELESDPSEGDAAEPEAAEETPAEPSPDTADQPAEEQPAAEQPAAQPAL